MNLDCIDYIEKEILVQYRQFDKGHDENHVRNVIKESVTIAENYDVDIDMVYVIAAYHDVGLVVNREFHHIHSGEILMQDEMIKQWFNLEQRIIMKEAIEDHRASNTQPPRSIYGCIVADADREIDSNRILYRCIQYRLNKGYHEFNTIFEESYQHMLNKYGENGYLQLWLDVNHQQLDRLRFALKDKEQLKKDGYKIYQEIKENMGL